LHRLVFLFLFACATAPETDPSETASDTESSQSETDSMESESETDDSAPALPDRYSSLVGDCGVLAPAALQGADPAWYSHAVTLEAGMWVVADLSDGAQEILADGNLGGSSLESEAMSFDILTACEGATLLATESEVSYSSESSKKTDYVAEIDGVMVGVSVTRAVHWPREEPMSAQDATDLLTDKLDDILLSSAAVEAPYQWEKQLLSVLAWDEPTADTLQTAWDALPGDVRADTILWVTATNGEDAFLY